MFLFVSFRFYFRLKLLVFGCYIKFFSHSIGFVVLVAYKAKMVVLVLYLVVGILRYIGCASICVLG